MTEVTSGSTRWRDLLRGEGLRARLLRGGIGSLFVKAASMGLTLATAVVLARALGAEGYGVYSFVFAIAALLATPAQLGLPTLLVRETANARVAGDDRLMRGVWLWAGGLALRASVVLMLIGAVVAAVLAGRETVGLGTLWAWSLLLIPLVALGNIRGAALQGLGRVVVGQAPEHLVRPALFVLFCLVVWGLAGGLTPTNAMIAHVAAAALAFAFGALVLHRAAPRGATASPDAATRKRWLHAVIPMAIVAGMQMTNLYVGVITLGLLGDAEAVGVFRVVVQGATLVGAGMTAINAASAPHFARLHAQGDRRALQRAATWSARASLATALLIALPLMVMAGPALGLVFGDEFRVGGSALIWVASGQLVSAALGPVGYLLMMCGGERRMVGLLTAGAVLNLALNVTLIPALGLTGAAVAHAVSTCALNIGLWFAVRRAAGVSGSAFALRPHPFDKAPLP